MQDLLYRFLHRGLRVHFDLDGRVVKTSSIKV